MAKILQNTTASPVDITDVGIQVAASGNYTIQPVDYALFSNSDSVIVLIGDGTLTVNDGSNTLGVSDGVDVIKGFSNKITNELVSIVDDSGTKRFAVDLSNTITGPQGDQGIQGIQGDPGPIGPASVFGSEYHYEESEGESTTTSGSYQTKLTLTTSSLPLGQYIINWNLESETTDNDMNIRCRLNDTDIIAEFERGDNDYYQSSSGFRAFTLSGVNFVDIDFNDDGGGTAKLRRARLSLWRVS